MSFIYTHSAILRLGVSLPTIRALFWDIGGVLMTNAWDHNERIKAFAEFKLDPDEFHRRHDLVVSSFERGKISLDEYLDRTVFYKPRPFTRDAFKQFMFSLSQPFPDSLEFAQSLASSRRYLMSTLNNESHELNLYRIDKYGLRSIFQLFISSCFVGFRKPEREIYGLALDLTQIDPKECCFIDDRELNLECAAALGMNTIQRKSFDQLRADLAALGVIPSKNSQ